MTKILKKTRSCVALIGALGATTGVAAAVPGGVAYIDGGHVQIAKLDGTKKIQLSDGLAWWNAAAQSDTGGVLATKNEPGKIAQLSLFQTWDASGNPAKFGPLNHDAFGASLAMPLTLEMAASNGLMLYGYSALFYGFPTATFIRGYYAQATATAAVGTPLNQTALRWPTLAGDRVVGTPDERTIAVLNADQNFVGSQSTPWPNIDVSLLTGATSHRTSLSTDGTVLAAEVAFETDSSKILRGGEDRDVPHPRSGPGAAPRRLLAAGGRQGHDPERLSGRHPDRLEGRPGRQDRRRARLLRRRAVQPYEGPRRDLTDRLVSRARTHRRRRHLGGAEPVLRLAPLPAPLPSPSRRPPRSPPKR